MSNEKKDLETSPPSRVQGSSRTLFKDTLARALLADDAKKLRAICDSLCDMALDNNLSAMERTAAIKLIIERVDGRPSQQIEVTDNTERPSAGLFKIVKIDGT